ncbi:MAG TPA: glycosyltransferase family 4 protein [Vicinamibacterales bacterium]|jgi:glycosyltransferase involved in cell wall biosynthesis
MRIAQFIDTESLGGAETLLMELSGTLRQQGHEVILYHFGSPHLHEFAEQNGFCERTLPGYKHYKSLYTLPAFTRLLRCQLKADGINVLHSHLLGPIVGGTLATAGTRINHVGTLHDAYTIEERPSRIRLLQLAAIGGTQLVCVGETLERFYRARGWFPRRRLSVVRNGVSRLQPLDKQARAGVRAAFGFSSEAVVIVCVGRLEALKRQHLLIELLPELRRRTGADCRLLLVGEGEQRRVLERNMTEQGVSSFVTLTGNRHDVPTLLGASDIFVLPSSTEGLSRSVLEAMSVGLPIVATDVGSNRDLLGPNERGLLVPADDSKGLLNALERLVNDEALRLSVRRNAATLVATCYRQETMVASYIHMYERGTLDGLHDGGAVLRQPM